MINKQLSKQDYLMSYFHYFTLEYVKEVGGTPCFLIDTETNELKYSFVEIVKNFYVDVNGIFTSLESRNFSKAENPDLEIIRFNTYEQARNYLNYLKVRHTDVAIKRFIRTYIRNNVLTLAIHNPKTRDGKVVVGLVSIDGVDVVEYYNNGNLSYLFYKDNMFGEFFYSMSKLRIKELYIGDSYFIKYSDWKKKIKKG